MKHYVLQYLAPERLMVLLKIFIYSCLCINGYEFITDDINAAKQLLTTASPLSEIVNTFAVTIDTLAWISLLVVFELKTYLLDDKLLRQRHIKWSLSVVTALCYMAIIYAFAGYTGKLIMLLDSAPYALGNPCDLVNTSNVLITTLDEYAPITEASCQALNPATMGQIVGQPIVFEHSAYGEVKILAWIDEINSATWILVVVMLQMDIILQLKGALSKRIMRTTALLKAILYTILFINAVLWGMYGSFIDFWDAVLWLLGFLIIELNIFNWNQEVEEELAQQKEAASK